VSWNEAAKRADWSRQPARFDKTYRDESCLAKSNHIRYSFENFVSLFHQTDFAFDFDSIIRVVFEVDGIISIEL
jgi:hypothetical protein